MSSIFFQVIKKDKELDAKDSMASQVASSTPFNQLPIQIINANEFMFKSTQGTVLNTTASRDYTHLCRAKEIFAKAN